MRVAAACVLSAAAGALVGSVITWRVLGPGPPAGSAPLAGPGLGGAPLPRLLAQAAANADELERLRRDCQRAPAVDAALAAEAAPAPGERPNPFAFPADLDARYRGPALSDALAKALAATGVTGEITKVDCSEFPCLVHGEVVASESLEQARADVRRLQDSAAAAYAGSDSYSAASDFKPDNPGDFIPSVLWTASFYPKIFPDEQRAVLPARLNDRRKAYVDTQLATLRAK